MLRDWLLSRQCQLAAQTVVGVLIASVFTVVRPLHFSYACLAPVFVIIIIHSLAQDQHVGSRIQVTAMLLGPTWLAVVLAAALMTLAKLAEGPSAPYAPGYVVAATLLAVLGLAVLVLVRAAAPAGPARLMGLLSTVIYGIMVILSVAHPGIEGALRGAIAPVLLSVVVGSAASLIAGLAVAPSLASDEVARLTAEALQGAASILSYHTSVLMAEHQLPTTASKQPTAGASSTHKGADIHITVHAAPATAVAAATGRRLHRGSIDGRDDGAATAAAVTAEHVAAAREHEHATLDWVPHERVARLKNTSTVSGIGHFDGNRTSSNSIASNVSSGELSDPNGMKLDSTDDTTAAAQQQGPRLDLELLRAFEAAAGSQENDYIRENITAVWLAAAASRQASLISEAGGDDASAPPVPVQQLPSTGPLELGHARRSLDRAASITFLPEADDQAFLQAMRTLSRSKPYGSAHTLHQPAQQQTGRPQQQCSYARSAASVESNAGSTADELEEPSTAAAAAGNNAGEDYTRWHRGAGHVTWADAAETPAAAQGTSKSAKGRTCTSNSSSSTRVSGQEQQNSRGKGLSSLLATIAHSLSRFGRAVRPHRSQTQQLSKQPCSRTPLPHSISWVDLANTPAVGSTAPAAPDQPAASRGLACHHEPQPAVHVTRAAAAAAAAHHTTRRHQSSSSTALQNTESSSATVVQGAGAAGPAYWNQTAPITAAQLGLLIGRAKALIAAARLEPAWLRPNGLCGFQADAWAALLEDAELLLVRVSTLEALSGERRLQGLQLHHLQHYRDIADAMSMTLAQLAAFLAHVSEALKQQQASRHVPTFLAQLLCLGRPRRSKPRHQDTRKQQHTTAKQQPTQQPQGAAAAPSKSPSPFAAAAATKFSTDNTASASQDVVSWSAVLSGLERQGSGVSSYLWEKKAGWETGRQLLQREMEAAVGGYWWAVRTASRQAPVQVPGSREVMTLTFVWPITNGLLDALERVEASAQRVLSSSKAASMRQHHASTAGGKQLSVGAQFAGWSLLARGRLWLQEQKQWLGPLVTLLTVQPGLQAIRQAVFMDLPGLFKSKAEFTTLLSSRTFQAGMKLYLAIGSTMVLTLVLMVYVPAVRQVAPIFGFTSVCLSMQERVEATADKVVGRILGTILGATIGLAITQIPNIFHTPVLLLACIGGACVPLSILAKAGARVAVALALLTLLAVALCSHEMVCCSPASAPHMGAVDVFVARLGSVVGACIYVALLNQFILPWYTSDYALEQMADALQQAAALFEKIYLSQYNRMRVAAVAAGAMVDGMGVTAAPCSADGQAPAAALGSSVDQQLSMHKTASSDTTPFQRIRMSFDRHRPPDMHSQRAAAPAGLEQATPTPLEAAAAELAALEATEAALHVTLRQEVLRRLVHVQLSLAKESVSWKSGVLATPQVVFNVLGAMVELVEALACQRLALAPFTRQAASAAAGMAAAAGSNTDGSMPGGLLRISGHCFSVWAQPLHPCWLEVLAAVQDLAQATVQQLRTTHAAAKEHNATSSSNSSADELLAKLSRLEAARLELRRGWLAIRTNLHRHVHAGAAAPASTTDLCKLPAGVRFWPIDSVHFFTFTYGASRVLNKLAGVTYALLAA